MTDYDIENPVLKNSRFEVIVDGITEYVDANIMMKVSGLFLRKYIDEQKKPSNYSIDFRDIKYRGRLVSQFLKVCQGQSADIKLSDIYYMLLISEEWESPEISNQLAMFLESKVEPLDLLSRFSTYIKSQQDVSNSLIDVLASKFKYIYKSDNFIELPPKYICTIIHNPKCEMPPREEFDKCIVEIIGKHKIRCSSLVKCINLLKTDEKNLIKLNVDYLTVMYPEIKEILRLRQCKSENEKLHNENDDLKKENDNLRRQLRILSGLKKENEDLKRQLKNREEQQSQYESIEEEEEEIDNQ